MRNITDHASTEASPASAPGLRRCQFSFADGRRCRTPRWEAHPALCVTHARAERKTESQSSAVPNFSGELAPLSGEFRTATDVNRALGRLFSLLAENRIPRRNAVALGYLAQLLLQTLPGVREELTHCLGYQAWDETLESVFPEHKTEDETEEDETETAAEDEAEDETEDKPKANEDPETSPGCGLHLQPARNNASGLYSQPAFINDSGHAEPASRCQPNFVPPVDEQKTVPARTEPHDPAPAQTEAEIVAEPEPLEFLAEPPEHWSYWKELEQNEHLRKLRH